MASVADDRERSLRALTLRMYRINAGMSQRSLAEATGLAHRTIARIEEGDLPSPATALKIAQVFEMQPTDLFPELVGDQAA